MCLCGIISFAGIVANIINIIVFIRQGPLTDSNTFSLLALSVSDLLGLISLLWLAGCYVLVYTRPPYVPFDPLGVLVITGGRPHVMFVQTSGWITVYIAFERCLCVVLPFRVGRMFTGTRTAILIPSIVLTIVVCGYVPYYLVEYLVWREIPGKNRSIMVVYRNADYRDVTAVYGVLNALVSKPTALILVFCLTQITVIRVNASRKWRQMTSSKGGLLKSQTNTNRKTKTNSKTITKTEKIRENETESKFESTISSSTSTVISGADQNGGEEGAITINSDNNNKIGAKEKRLVKMIWMICVIFLVCMTPNMACIIVRQLIPEIRPGRKYSNFYFFIYAFSFFLEGVNSSINIFVYYNMSSRYRSIFRNIMKLDK